jgi:hypothetical protein
MLTIRDLGLRTLILSSCRELKTWCSASLEGMVGRWIFSGLNQRLEWSEVGSHLNEKQAEPKSSSWTSFAPLGPKPQKGPFTFDGKNTRAVEAIAFRAAPRNMIGSICAKLDFVSETTLTRESGGSKENV